MALEPPTVRRRLRAPARREQLLDVAAELVVDQGFHALSIEAVAQRAGVTRAVIYQHFADLPDVLDTVLEREMERALTQLVPAVPTDVDVEDPREELLAGLAAFLAAVRAHPGTWRLVLIPTEGAPPGLRQRIEQGRSAVLRQLAAALGPASGTPGSPAAALTAHVLSAVADEYARLVLTDPVAHPVPQLLEHARALLHGGLLGR